MARLVIQVARQQLHGCLVQHVRRPPGIEDPIVVAPRSKTPPQVHGVNAPIFESARGCLDLVREKVLFCFVRHACDLFVMRTESKRLQ